MRRLDYHIIVQNNGTVQARLNNGEQIISSHWGELRLDNLELITKDYLPLLETGTRQPRERLERLGALLYELLFSSIHGHFEFLALQPIINRPENHHLSLALIFQEGLRADVMALPWEFLYYAPDRIFLATNPHISFARCYSDWISPPVKYVGPEESLRILLIRLQPDGKDPVALISITNLLNEIARERPRLLATRVLENPPPLQVEKVLQDYRPHLVHFLLHGRFEDRGTRFALVGNGQQARWYGDRSFADLFAGWRPHLILLQACEGGRNSDLLSFMNGAAWLIRNHVPAVIAMYYPITNQVGLLFAQAFYTHLLAKNDLDASVQQARRLLAKYEIDPQVQDDHATRDFAAPILWTRPEARQLFTEALDDVIPEINLNIITPSGEKYAIDVPCETSINTLLSTFLQQWHAPDAQISQRYSLALKLQGLSTLRQVGLTGQADLLLIPEALAPSEPIRLIIKNEKGEKYSVAVLLSMQVGEVAKAFLLNTPGTGEIVVEWISDASLTEQKFLKLDASLYEQGVNNDAFLLIYRKPSEPGKE